MDFPRLRALTSTIDEAEARYSMKTSKTYDHAKIAAAAADFNAVLEQAARAIAEDLGNDATARAYLEEWRPTSSTDTWFGPDPGKFLRHVLETGKVHRGLLPDQSAIH